MLTSIVSRDVFESLACNRCGQCCERHFGSCAGASPLETVSSISFADRENGQWMDLDVWFGQQVPIGPNEDGDWQYRCPLVAYADELAVCTIYDHRPGVCYHYPYDRPTSIEKCVWHVEILEDHLPWLPEKFV